MNFTNYTPPDWNTWFLQGVYWIASKSKDPKTKIGAIVVKDNHIISTGYNGIPEGVEDDALSRNERPEKYKWYEHGERNAIYNAARHGISTTNTILYTNTTPCADCARGIIRCGIKEVFVHRQFVDLTSVVVRDQWKGHDATTITMFKEARIGFYEIDAVLGCKAYFDGKIYEV